MIKSKLESFNETSFYTDKVGPSSKLSSHFHDCEMTYLSVGDSFFFSFVIFPK